MYINIYIYIQTPSLRARAPLPRQHEASFRAASMAPTRTVKGGTQCVECREKGRREGVGKGSREHTDQRTGDV